MLTRGHLHEKKKTYTRNWGLKRVEGVSSKGAYFQMLTVCLGTHKPSLSAETVQEMHQIVV